MSKKRISGAQRQTRRRVASARTKSRESSKWTAIESAWPAKAYRQGLKVHHFGGVALGGGKTDKTCLAVVEYYPNQNKIFLSRLFEKIRTEGESSADLQLHQLISEGPGPLELVAFDVPLKLPKCLRCRLRCPGFEDCKEPEILWMWQKYRELNDKRKPKRLFTPYTERAVEIYLTNELEENFPIGHALGSNLAPLTARAQFVARRLQTPLIEFVPRLSVWRMGRSLQISRAHLLFHKHAVSGAESRRLFLQKLIERDLVFLYDQDLKSLVDNNQAFESFIGALTAVLYHLKKCEARPKGFPKSEAWIALPASELRWG